MNEEPLPLGDALAELSRKLKLPEPSAFEQVTALWNELVGPAVASHAKVASLRDGTCTVEVDGPVWATQCKFLESDLVERASKALGPGRVTSVRIAVRGPRTDR